MIWTMQDAVDVMHAQAIESFVLGVIAAYVTLQKVTCGAMQHY